MKLKIEMISYSEMEKLRSGWWKGGLEKLRSGWWKGGLERITKRMNNLSTVVLTRGLKEWKVEW